MADFRSFHGELVITTGLGSIERALSKVYTREIFYEVKKQIEGVSSFLVLHKESFGCTEKFMLRKFRKPNRGTEEMEETDELAGRRKRCRRNQRA
ncbi:hypothetical protein PIB30_056360 [Stylosanthes scabra]|uniref:Uncharacterized protein n=1 Tax=Stylosanthes scabra TaxID=79078 RepID=A0ABU6QJQ7_9FABA|nr:hypothetical protein [Stylosanthes scabra]